MKCRRERIEADFSILNGIGRLENGGFTRLAFSEEDMAARRWLMESMRSAGLDVTVDPIGNIRGRRRGRQEIASVMIGSHLDTVPEGGNFDGVVGVLAGMEVVRTLNEHQIDTERSIEIVNFSAEESSRFGMATLGSKAVLGRLDREQLQSLTDRDGLTLYQVLKNCGYRPDDISDAALSPGQIHAFLEMHIEQGPILEHECCSAGLVTAIGAPTRYKVMIEGQADHSGNTPMAMRKDALAGASELVLGIEGIARKGSSTVGTVGYMSVSPGAMNVIPGKVELGIDLRDVDRAAKDAAMKDIQTLFATIASSRQLTVHHELLCDDDPVVLPSSMVRLLENCASQLGIDAMNMISGAGHDAMNMARLTDAGMIFIPSVGGLSHNIAEMTSMEDICTGTNLLIEAAVRLAQSA